MRSRSLLFLVSVWSLVATAQPQFNGPRADDAPLPDVLLESISEKNRGIELPDISQGQGWDTIEIRIYAFGNITYGRHGPPTMLTRLRVRGGELDEAWLYFICPTSGQLAIGDLTQAWRVLVEEQFFSIPDQAAIPGYTGTIRDGELFAVQIASFDGSRAFRLGNPGAEPNAELAESQRFLRSIAALKALFPSPEKFCREPD